MEHGRLGDDFARRVQGEGGAVEHQFVLAAYQVDVDQRQTALPHPFAGHPPAFGDLVHMEWRGVQHQQHVGTGVARHLRGLAHPHVFADIDAEARALA